MFLSFSFLILTTLFSPSQSQSTFDDMSDEDFVMLTNAYGDIAVKYAPVFAKGCVKGGTVAGLVGKGIPALCLGCAVNGLGDVAAEMAFPREPEKKQ